MYITIRAVSNSSKVEKLNEVQGSVVILAHT